MPDSDHCAECGRETVRSPFLEGDKAVVCSSWRLEQRMQADPELRARHEKHRARIAKAVLGR